MNIKGTKFSKCHYNNSSEANIKKLKLKFPT